jgi:hypothetical protein
MSWFTKGLEDVLSQSTDRTYDRPLFLPEFFLSEGETKVLYQIVDVEPFNAFVHTIEKRSKSGKIYRVTKTCSLNPNDPKSSCHYCDCFAESVPGVTTRTFRAHLTILDSRMWEYEIDGERQNNKARWTQRLWRASSRRIAPLSQIDQIERRGGRLDGILLTATRIGSGRETQYVYNYVSRKTVKNYDIYAKLLGDWDPAEKGAKWAPCPQFPDGKVVPFDYEELLKPDTYEEASKFMSRPSAKEEIEEDVSSGADSYFEKIAKKRINRG